jgi:hypothetical protein
MGIASKPEKSPLSASAWDRRRVRAAPTAHSESLGGATIVFDERLQKIFEQNETSAATWRAVADGNTLSDAAKALAAEEDYATAIQHVHATVLGWMRHGLIVPQFMPSSSTATSIKIGWRGSGIDLRLSEGVDAAAVQDVFANLLSSEQTGTVLRIERIADLFFIVDEQGGSRARSASEWVPEVKAMLTDKVLESAADGFLVHAALVSRRGHGVLICGGPGAGKSTLSLSLALGGFSFHTDDIVHFSERREALGVPFAMALKAGAWPLLQQMGQAAHTSPTYLRGDGQQVRYLRGADVRVDAVPLTSILLLARDPDGPARIEDVDPLEVLTTVLGSAYSARGALSGQGFEALVDAIRNARTGRLCFSDWQDGRRLVDAFAP